MSVQHWNHLAEAVYSMLDAYSGSEAVTCAYCLLRCCCCRPVHHGRDDDAVQVIAICGAFFEFFMAVMGSYGKHMKQVFCTL